MNVFKDILGLFKNRKSAYYYMKGCCSIANGRYLDAIAFFDKSMACSVEAPHIVYDCKKYMGISYFNDEQYLKAKDYLLEAEKMWTIKDKTLTDCELLMYLGLVYDREAVHDREENLKKARQYYQLAIKNYKRWDPFTNIDYISSRLIKIDEWFCKSRGER